MWSIADAENNKSGRGNENSIQEKFRFGEGGEREMQHDGQTQWNNYSP